MRLQYLGEKTTITFCKPGDLGRGQDVELGEVLGLIKGDGLKGQIEAIRAAADKAERDLLKKLLPGVIFTGSLSGKKGKRVRFNPMVPRSGIVCLDFDRASKAKFHQGGGVSPQARALKDLLQCDPFVVAAFFSPSGDGVKALIRCDDFENGITALFDHYEKLTGYLIDKQSRTRNGHCYLSNDPELGVNFDAVVFPVPVPVSVPVPGILGNPEIAPQMGNFGFSPSLESAKLAGSGGSPGQTGEQVRVCSSPTPPTPPLYVSMCHTELLCVTREREKTAGTRIRSSLEARARFAKSRKNIFNFFVEQVERVFTPKQGQRNSDLTKIMGFGFHSLCEKHALLFARQFYLHNRHIWADSLKDHMYEAGACLKGLREKNLKSLNPEELEFYSASEAQVQDGFRICRDLGSRAKARTGEPLFFMAQNQLALRVGYESTAKGGKPSEQGARILGKLIEAGFVEIVKKGQQGNPGRKKLLATEYRWLGSITSSEIYNKGESR